MIINKQLMNIAPEYVRLYTSLLVLSDLKNARAVFEFETKGTLDYTSLTPWRIADCALQAKKLIEEAIQMDIDSGQDQRIDHVAIDETVAAIAISQQVFTKEQLENAEEAQHIRIEGVQLCGQPRTCILYPDAHPILCGYDCVTVDANRNLID